MNSTTDSSEGGSPLIELNKSLEVLHYRIMGLISELKINFQKNLTEADLSSNKTDLLRTSAILGSVNALNELLESHKLKEWRQEVQEAYRLPGWRVEASPDYPSNQVVELSGESNSQLESDPKAEKSTEIHENPTYQPCPTPAPPADTLDRARPCVKEYRREHVAITLEGLQSPGNYFVTSLKPEAEGGVKDWLLTCWETDKQCGTGIYAVTSEAVGQTPGNVPKHKASLLLFLKHSRKRLTRGSLRCFPSER